jgi:hypothetical protein
MSNDAPTSTTKPLGSNPKDLLGYKKVDLSLLPDIAVFHGAHAMMDGARKYGPYNWRDNAVLARVYIAAAKRHLDYWAAGEETAKDSQVHHLGHALACIAIVLDAQATGNLIDDRAKSPALIAAFDALNDQVKAAAEARAKEAAHAQS